MRFLEGGCPSKKQIENAVSRISRIKGFLSYMSLGSNQRWTWLFLGHTERIHSWTRNLLKMGKKYTTVVFYLRNVYSFLVYFRETPPQLSRLPKTQLISSIRAVQKGISQLQRRVSVHQIKVKSAKELRAISPNRLAKCKEMAAQKIPELLAEMEGDNSQQLRYRFYGYLSAFIASIYGHRTGVLTNMTVEEVEEAKANHTPQCPGFVINVAEHKTNKAFGSAQIFLHPLEFQWLEKWLELRERLRPKTNLVFFCSNEGYVKNLVKYLQLAWSEMGLPGRPTFIDIRSAVATHAKAFHSEEVRRKLSAVMCHNTTTADKFYVQALKSLESAELRQQFEEATAVREAPGSSGSTTPARSASQSGSSSDEDIQIPYQETGTSSLEEEMMEVAREKKRRMKMRLKLPVAKMSEDSDDDDDDDEVQQAEQTEEQQQEEMSEVVGEKKKKRRRQKMMMMMMRRRFKRQRRLMKSRRRR